MGSIYGGEAEKKMPLNELESGIEASLPKEGNEPQKEENIENEADLQEITAENTPTEEENAIRDEATTAPSVMLPDGEANSSANFFARVFTGESTYPVAGARVVIYRGDNIYAFLETDENGRTKSVKLPAFSESNSLEPENENQSIAYNADIFASGFTSQKGLLVSAVGGSEIVLNVLLVPEKEGLS